MPPVGQKLSPEERRRGEIVRVTVPISLSVVVNRLLLLGPQRVCRVRR